MFSNYGLDVYNHAKRYTPKFVRDQNQQIIDLINELIPENGTVVDVACGTGTILQGLDCSLTRIGLDIACGMTEKAQQTTATDISYCVMDVENVALKRNIADVVLCKNSFYFMSPNKSIASFSWLTRPGGHLVLTSYLKNPDKKKLWQTALFDTTKRPWIDFVKLKISPTKLLQAFESSKKEMQYQTQVEQLTKDPLSLPQLFDFLKDNSFNHIRIIDDNHYCGTQYLIVASKV